MLVTEYLSYFPDFKNQIEVQIGEDYIFIQSDEIGIEIFDDYGFSNTMYIPTKVLKDLIKKVEDSEKGDNNV